MKRFGLLGKTLSHSFSKKYFTDKFTSLGLTDHVFELYEIANIEDFPSLIQSQKGLAGMNVTIPYKEQVMAYLDGLDMSATKVGAVNVIKFENDGRRIGYNSDYYGFKTSLQETLNKTGITVSEAIILGTGGAAKAVYAALKDMEIAYTSVSRDKNKADMDYRILNSLSQIEPRLIINASPVGTYPDVNNCPDFPYHLLTNKHLLFDLVYNPEETQFMKNGQAHGAFVKNGLEMLHLQAEKAWDIWQG